MAKEYTIAFNDIALDEHVYGDVVVLKIEQNTLGASTLYLQLASRRLKDGSWTYFDDHRLALFTKVTVKIGFTGDGGSFDDMGCSKGGNEGLKTVFDGYITGVDITLSSEPGSSFVNVNAMDPSVLMSLEEKIATWPNMADSDIVERILANYGLPLKADRTATKHLEADTTVVQRGTDIQFVRNLARRNGLEFYFDTDEITGKTTGYFLAPQLDGAPQRDLAVQFGDESNLVSFSARLCGLRPLTVKLVQMDVKTNRPNTAQIGDTLLTKLGDDDANALIGAPVGSLVRPKDAIALMLVMGTPTSDATEMKTLGQAVRDEAGWFITAKGEINSDAYQSVLRPHRLVLVKGAGKPYSGKYYVTKVVHELKHDGTYTQTFEARRNARDRDGSGPPGSLPPSNSECQS